jgi:hypothetical protein
MNGSRELSVGMAGVAYEALKKFPERKTRQAKKTD